MLDDVLEVIESASGFVKFKTLLGLRGSGWGSGLVGVGGLGITVAPKESLPLGVG